ncbi:MAG TPA: AmmeMemoRadiSam system protein A [Symbiobacteriaceae bacterium]|nr:AmmeMemoRadiSam system protein A [Symbiobacteriaceae bacterium]
MQELVYTALVPHPPILIPAVGGEEVDRVRATHSAMEQVAADLARLQPETVVIISPHGPVFRDAIAVHMIDSIRGDLGAFRAPQVSFDLPIDRDLGALVVDSARQAGLPVAPVTEEWASEWQAERLDHGTMVPLYFVLEGGWKGKILPIAMGMLSPVQLYAFGQALQEAIDRADRRIAVLASGDLSHRLTPDAPAGYHPEAHQFDREVVEALGRGDLGHLFRLDHNLCECAGECGLRPMMMLAGTLDGLQVKPQVLSYEGPFGVGYAVVPMVPGVPDPQRQLLPALVNARRDRVQKRREQAHPLVNLARTALEHYVRTGLELDFSAGAPHEGTAPWQLPPGLPEQAGVFVSLKMDGELRGCMGTTEPAEPTLALEVVRNAIMAGTRDPRFSPVEEEELEFLDYSVDVLFPAEPCAREDLDPAKYGVIVQKGRHTGLLLPDLPGVDTVDEQVSIAARKAGLSARESGLKLFRFRVDRFR